MNKMDMTIALMRKVYLTRQNNSALLKAFAVNIVQGDQTTCLGRCCSTGTVGQTMLNHAFLVKQIKVKALW